MDPIYLDVRHVARAGCLSIGGVASQLSRESPVEDIGAEFRTKLRGKLLCAGAGNSSNSKSVGQGPKIRSGHI